MDDLVPITVLAGFLGAGKTPLLNRLLKQPELANTAVLINEFGDVGIDHLLVETLHDDVVLLNAGCLCCTIRGDLVTALRNLSFQRVRREVPQFERVMIETTGLADPAPILHTLMTDPLIRVRYRLDGVVILVDATNGEATLNAQPEAVKQAAVADRIVLTKADLASAAQVALAVRRPSPDLCRNVQIQCRQAGRRDACAMTHGVAAQLAGPHPAREPPPVVRGFMPSVLDRVHLPDTGLAIWWRLARQNLLVSASTLLMRLPFTLTVVDTPEMAARSLCHDLLLFHWPLYADSRRLARRFPWRWCTLRWRPR